MKTVCKINMCTGCMACINVCPVHAINLFDNLDSYNMVIDESKCILCGKCTNVCPNQSQPIKREPIAWLEGWALDSQIRLKASSGGVATSLARYFIKNGGVCFLCTLDNGEFVYTECTSVQDAELAIGSKYVKSNPDNVYKRINNLLNEDKKVLVIGLPCHVAGIKNFIPKMKEDNLFLIDLICHGSPSPQLLKFYLEEKKHPINTINDLKFRNKVNGISFRLPDSVSGGVIDRYTEAFLSGLDYTESCYECNYAGHERISDITLGDSWGSKLPEEEKKNGISLILCQTAKGKHLIESAGIYFDKVDPTVSMKFNKQLVSPMEKHKCRDLFFNNLKKTRNFSKSYFKCFPKTCIRHEIKAILLKIGIVKK